ncbi:GNAT family N-acetyltransferase [Altericroceibacterium xinjiangense]|uniref:GNAT family N-acetyltransferase n=1 Tax=Altericroceibacterium xinjiangense TaxID=762261 RepID=UPI000F7E1E04|nr:GNAT family N-acetyltransferase [Altericroceibacterium xinjiangense]
MAEFRLETERLVLRDWQDADREPFFRHTNTPAVMRWLDGLLDEDGRRAMWERVDAYRRDYGHTFWAVERKADGGHLSGELLGFCGLKRANQQGAPIGDFEIGWRFREDAWGHGYAREAAVASMNAAFERFNAPHVIALTVNGNTASWGLMKRLGMKRRPDLDFESEDFGADEGPIIIYSINRDEWEGLFNAA